MIAPDQIEPYTVRLYLTGRLSDPPRLVAALLRDIAERCSAAGASVIGHLKCHARTSSGSFHCNLTSLRSGARCRGLTDLGSGAVQQLELDLAVLVYGLGRAAVGGHVAEALDTQSSEVGWFWKRAPAREHEAQ